MIAAAVDPTEYGDSLPKVRAVDGTAVISTHNVEPGFKKLKGRSECATD